MKLEKLLHDDNFNIFFSVMLGIGIICIFRPMCKGSECNLSKPPSEKDFDKYVYRLGGNCYQFASETITCPASGAIEAFGGAPACSSPVLRSDNFTRRTSLIQ